MFFFYIFLSWQKLVRYLLSSISSISFLPSDFFKSSSFLAVPFLNLISNIEERSGSVFIRLGGNTQEFATMVPSLANGSTFFKGDSGSTQTVRY